MHRRKADQAGHGGNFGTSCRYVSMPSGMRRRSPRPGCRPFDADIMPSRLPKNIDVAFRTIHSAKGLEPCPRCRKGTVVSRQGKFGSFLGCSAYPMCRYTRKVTPDRKGTK
ncbi:MAG: topoisomerase DNA-binding C4 zinc finger domain-containing protein [Candidatus Dormibacteria bacterium]